MEAPTGPWTLRDTDGEINETSVQPGSGSWDGIATLHWAHTLKGAATTWFATGFYRRNGTNDLDYRIGDDRRLDGGLVHRLKDTFAVSVQANVRSTGRDDYRGDGVGSTGFTQVSVTPGISLGNPADLSAYLFLQLPVYQDVNEAQLGASLGVLVGVSKAF